MKNLYLIIAVLFFIFSCKQESLKTEYYPNGNKQKEYRIKNGLHEGLCTEFYDNGNKKSEYYYKSGVPIDSSVHYNKTKGFIERVDFYKENDTVYSKYFNEKGKYIEEGKMFKNQKVGKWLYYHSDGYKEKEFEYLNINGEQYTNQGVYFDKKGDTIKEFGNYYHYYLTPKKILAGEKFEIIIKYKPLLVKNGNVIALVSPKVNSDFSNINDLPLDTIVFIENTAKQIISFRDKGNKNLRGIIKELYEVKEDSIVTRNLYIDIPINVD